jgi:hypothetical protein
LAAIFTGLVFFMAFAPLVGWYLLRDVQLRRRIRHILRARAMCPGCGYRLVGLFVNAGHKVVCPECAMETEVDPSLSELTTDDAGRAMFNPAPPKPTWWQRRMTARRKKWIRRAAMGLVILVIAGIPLGWAGYELFLRHQAAIAKRERPGAAGLMALVQKYQPAPGGEDVPDGWTFFEKAVLLADATDGKLWKGGWPTTRSGARQAPPDFSMIFSEAAPGGEAELDEANRISRAGGLRSLEAWQRAGVFAEIDKIAASPRAVRPIDIGPEQPMVGILLPTLGKSRQFARACAARMYVAQMRGDRETYVRSLEEMMAVSRIDSQQPLIIDRLVSIAIDSLAYGRVQSTLVTHPSDEWLDGIEGAMDRQGWRAPPELVVEGERIASLDTSAWLFSDPDRVRGGRFSKGVGSIGAMAAPSPLTQRLGTYWENRDTINRHMDWFESMLAKERFERGAMRGNPEPSSNLILINLLMPAYGHTLKSFDQHELERRGLRVSIALERYRLKHGEYPAALADLVPAHLSTIPIDPWSGKPLGYKRIDSVTDKLGRGYLLYSFGADGKDDGGVESASRWDALTNAAAKPAIKGATGTDFIVNVPSPLPSLEGLPEIPDMSKPVEAPADKPVE